MCYYPRKFLCTYIKLRGVICKVILEVSAQICCLNDSDGLQGKLGNLEKIGKLFHNETSLQKISS